MSSPRKQAMRTLFDAGKYLGAQYERIRPVSTLAQMDLISIGWAINIIANAYNEVLGV